MAAKETTAEVAEGVVANDEPAGQCEPHEAL